MASLPEEPSAHVERLADAAVKIDNSITVFRQEVDTLVYVHAQAQRDVADYVVAMIAAYPETYSPSDMVIRAIGGTFGEGTLLAAAQRADLIAVSTGGAYENRTDVDVLAAIERIVP